LRLKRERGRSWAHQAVALLALAPLLNTPAQASGHGPVFAMATPTNAKGGWSVDWGVMGRVGDQNSGAMGRAMLTYGITEDLQVSLSAPAVFVSAPLAPARLTGMMPGTADFEGIGAWRFHRQGTDVGRRFETTAYGGIVVPGPQRPAGMLGELRRAPGVYTAVANLIPQVESAVPEGVNLGADVTAQTPIMLIAP